MNNVLGYASPPSSVDDVDEVIDQEALNEACAEPGRSDSQNQPGDNDTNIVEEENFVVKRGRGRPRKFPPGEAPSDLLRARRVAHEPQAVVSIKEYAFRRRDKRSLSPDSDSDYPVRGQLRAQLEQDEEFQSMSGRTTLSGISVASKRTPAPYDGPKRGRGRPKKQVAPEETLTLD